MSDCHGMFLLLKSEKTASKFHCPGCAENAQLRAHLAQLAQWVRAHMTASSGEVLCCCHGSLERYNATCTYCQGRLLLADLDDAGHD